MHFLRHIYHLFVWTVYLLCNVYIFKMYGICFFHHLRADFRLQRSNCSWNLVYNSLHSEHSLQMCIWVMGGRAPLSLCSQPSRAEKKKPGKRKTVSANTTHPCTHVCQRSNFLTISGILMLFSILFVLLAGREAVAGLIGIKGGQSAEWCLQIPIIGSLRSVSSPSRPDVMTHLIRRQRRMELPVWLSLAKQTLKRTASSPPPSS